MTADEKMNLLASKLQFHRNDDHFVERSDLQSPFHSYMFFIGEGLCKEYIGEKADIFFVDSPKINAAADSETESIIIYTEMLDFLCRLALLLTAATPMPVQLKLTPGADWKTDPKSWLSTPGFDWRNNEYCWIRDEGLAHDIFLTHLSDLFSFVVLHETGHLHHLHMQRRKATISADIKAGEGGPKQGVTHAVDPAHQAPLYTKEHQVSSDTEVAAHAREVVADSHAFQFILEELTEDPKDVEGANIQDLQKIAFDKALTTVSIFFWGMSVVRPMNEESQQNLYPTHAFRLQAIESAALEHGLFGWPSEVSLAVFYESLKNAFTTLKQVCGGDHFILWRLVLNDPVHYAHYARICKEVPHWANCRFGQLDDQ